MVQTSKTFKEELIALREFLSERRKITALATELGVCRKTVQDALSVEKADDLKGKKINVVERARQMKKEIECALGFDGN